MDQKQNLKHLVEFNQNVFNNFFQALALFQGQFERITNSAIDQADWRPAESRKVIEDWDKSLKAACDNFKNSVDQSYKRVKKHFAG